MAESKESQFEKFKSFFEEYIYYIIGCLVAICMGCVLLCFVHFWVCGGSKKKRKETDGTEEGSGEGGTLLRESQSVEPGAMPRGVLPEKEERIPPKASFQYSEAGDMVFFPTRPTDPTGQLLHSTSQKKSCGVNNCPLPLDTWED